MEHLALFETETLRLMAGDAARVALSSSSVNDEATRISALKVFNDIVAELQTRIPKQ